MYSPKRDCIAVTKDNGTMAPNPCQTTPLRSRFCSVLECTRDPELSIWTRLEHNRPSSSSVQAHSAEWNGVLLALRPSATIYAKAPRDQQQLGEALCDRQGVAACRCAPQRWSRSDAIACSIVAIPVTAHGRCPCDDASQILRA